MNVARRMRWILLAGSLPAAARPFSVPPTTKHARRFDSLRRLSAHRENQQHHDDDGGKDSSSFGLYVHIPYCRRRCNYCDFAIVPIGGDPKKDDDIRSKSRTDGFERMDANYRNALLDEIATIGKTSSSSSSSSSSTTGEKIRLRSVYFGGGTPSLAPLSTLRQILHALLRSDDAPFRLEGDDVDDDDRASYEATIEMDPGTFDLDYLFGIREMGFNRISLGVQSFDDDLLATMGRVHRSTDVRRSVEMIGEVFGEGSANYSIDLISGVPGLTLAGWAETLYEAARLRPRPTHMSLYDLQVERGTTFGKWYGDTQREEERVIIPVTTRGHDDDTTHSTASRRHPVLPSAEDCAFMYSYASGYLRSKDYEHYEISSYAYGGGEDGFGASRHRAMHNQIYWQYDGQWYAVGLGATSNVDGVRFPRPRALSDYISWTESLSRDYFPEISGDGCDEGDDTRVPPWLRGEVTNANEGTDDEDDDDDDGLLDIVMTRLRTSEGLDLDWVAGRDEYGASHVEAILRGFGLALELGLGAREDDDDDADRRPRERNRHGRIRLNDPKGFLFSNNIISNIFVELSEMDS